MTDGLDEHGNSYILHPMTVCAFAARPSRSGRRSAPSAAVRADAAVPARRRLGRGHSAGGKLELIEGNHNPGMNIVQAPAKHGVHDKFAHLLLDFYGDPAQYAYETVKKP